MKLVVISGTTSTGKTTVGRKLAKDLGFQTFLKDDYKESRFDLLDKQPSFKQLSAIDKDSNAELLNVIKLAIREDKSLIVETNFTKTQLKQIRKLIKPNVTVIEIFCYANGFRVLSRYIKRYRSGERHKGHRDYLWYPIVAIEALGLGKLRYRPLRLSPNLLSVDSNSFSKVDYRAICRYVHNTK
jgi:predicted kinase